METVEDVNAESLVEWHAASALVLFTQFGFQVLQDMQQFAKAEEHFDRAIQLEPKNPVHLVYKGLVYPVLLVWRIECLLCCFVFLFFVVVFVFVFCSLDWECRAGVKV